MATLSRTGHHRCEIALDPPEGPIDAGAKTILTVGVTCPEGCDLAGSRVRVTTADGADLGQVRLEAGEEEDGWTGELAFLAPPVAGTHAMRLELVPEERRGILHEAEPVPFDLEVRPHDLTLTVWDLPSAIAAGDPFAFRVGVRCSAGCRLADQELRLVDHEGVEFACARTADTVWPGTRALYHAEATAEAPEAPGTYAWEVVAPAFSRELPHARGVVTFSLKAVPSPEHEVAVRVVDRKTQAPLAGATVVMHPYRARTGADGIARLAAAGGEYRIMVSASRHMPVNTSVHLTGNVTTTAELDEEPKFISPDESY